MFSEFNTPPGCASVNASSRRLPDTTHHSRPRRLARSYLVRLFHSRPSSGLSPTHPVPFSKLAERYREYGASTKRAWDDEKHITERFADLFGETPLAQITT